MCRAGCAYVVAFACGWAAKLRHKHKQRRYRYSQSEQLSPSVALQRRHCHCATLPKSVLGQPSNSEFYIARLCDHTPNARQKETMFWQLTISYYVKWNSGTLKISNNMHCKIIKQIVRLRLSYIGRCTVWSNQAILNPFLFAYSPHRALMTTRLV